MRKTDVIVLFGIYDVNAKQNGRVTSGSTYRGSNISDLEKDTTQINRYAVLEGDLVSLDGSFVPFPENPEHLGFWSEQMSDDVGRFRAPYPYIEVDFSEEHRSIGLTVDFWNGYVDDYPGETMIEWFDENDTVIAFKRFYPDESSYFFERNASYYKIRLTFYGTHVPYRRVRVSKIEYGAMKRFTSSELKSVKVSEYCDPISAEIPLNTLSVQFQSSDLSFSLLSPTGIYGYLQQRQKIEVIAQENGENIPFGTFYLDKWDSSKGRSVTLSGVDVLGVIDKSNFQGGIYENILLKNLLSQVLKPIAPLYTIADEMNAFTFTGYIPICTHRQALQQVCFASGAIVDTSRSDKINILKRTEETSKIIPVTRKFIGQTTKLNELITGVSVTAHTYQRSQQTTEMFKGILAEGVHEIVFREPVFDISATNAIVIKQSVNMAQVQVPKDAEVIISGKPFIDSMQIFNSKVKEAQQAPKTVTIDKAYLVDPEKAELLADNLLEFYTNVRYVSTFKVIPEDDRVGSLVVVETIEGDQLKGYITNIETTLTGGFVSTLKVAGYPLGKFYGYYMPEIYMNDNIGVI